MSDLTHAAFARLESSSVDLTDVQVKSVDGREAISQLFAFDIVLVSRDNKGPGIDELEGASVALEMGYGEEVVRRLHGILSHVSARTDQSMAQTVYRVTLSPRLWRATLVEMFEIQKDLSLPEILNKKLELIGLSDGADYETRFIDRYEQREFVLQYGESDHDFMARLCEHMGVSFIFEHGDDDRVVFLDNADSFAKHDGDLEYRQDGHNHGVFSIEHVRTPIPRMHVARDFNYRKPLDELHGEHELEAGFGGGVVEYGGHFKTAGGAQRLARIRAEESHTRKDVYVCASDDFAVTAGTRFGISGYHVELPPLLCTEVRHQLELTVHFGGETSKHGYRNEFRAIDASLTYRPPRRTPVPRISGALTGIIETRPDLVERYAKLDELGRYHVRFAFDTAALGSAESPSHRIRMLQPLAGQGYGIHFPLKPGTEVFVAFSNGDPDRPIIVGAAPNPATLTPVTQADATMNRIKTESGVLIEIEDGLGPRP